MNPIRTCIVCKNKFEKHNLIKITKTKNGEINVNGMQGRGAYVCTNPECHKKLVEKKVLNKAFRKDISVEIYQKVLEGVKNANNPAKN